MRAPRKPRAGRIGIISLSNFLPTTLAEARERGWDELDVVFVTGDAYIDHPSFGVPLLARWLESHGFRVGILAQPDWRRPEAFDELGRPRLFFAVTAGAMDSMVAHYTPEKRLRRDDAYTPGNRHGARPNRATIVYTSCCKAVYRDVPVVIGGIEASLRRFAHYDYWDDRVRRSLLVDSKADLLIYGMAERPILELANRLRQGEAFHELRDVRGTAYMGKELQSDHSLSASAGASPQIEWFELRKLPSYEEVSADRKSYADAFRLISLSQNPLQPVKTVQRHGDRILVCNPPALPFAQAQLDAVYALPFTRLAHPTYLEPIPAWEQIKTSVTTHRGCYGGCAFCAITNHQGKTIQSRSLGSILSEAERLAEAPWFKGSISDLGGPTANMYGTSCTAPSKGGSCQRPSCLYPAVCIHLAVDDRMAAEMLRGVRRVRNVRHVAVSSGIRYDLLTRQPQYFKELLAHHVGGLLKVAPEHCTERVLGIMRKPAIGIFTEFLDRFRESSRSVGKRQGVVPYLMSGHPGTTIADMLDLALFLRHHRLKVEQVQEFTPTPGSLSTCIYHTGIDPFTGKEIYVARGDREKRQQKALLLAHQPMARQLVREALRACGRQDAANILIGEPSGEFLKQKSLKTVHKLGNKSNRPNRKKS